MKKQKFNGKLKLNKEVISKLQMNEMSIVRGGSGGILCTPDPIIKPSDPAICFSKTCVSCQASMCNCPFATC